MKHDTIGSVNNRFRSDRKRVAPTRVDRTIERYILKLYAWKYKFARVLIKQCIARLSYSVFLVFSQTYLYEHAYI